jgi:hypothetical protein
VTRQRDVVGFPLHCGFTTAADVALRVRATGVHESRHPEVFTHNTQLHSNCITCARMPLSDLCSDTCSSVLLLQQSVTQPVLYSFSVCFLSIADNIRCMFTARCRLMKCRSQVQFALAVQCFPYCNNVLSVWVYVASITPKS